MRPEIRPNVLQMKPYASGKPADVALREAGVGKILRLSANENPWGPSPRVKEALERAVESAQWYPDAGSYRLLQTISEKFDVPANQILLGNGSDEIIRMLGWILIDGPQDEILMADPSFIVYAHDAQIAPCKLIKVPLAGGLEYDLAAMSQQISERTKIVFIANPNNPTGTYVKKPDVDAFLQDLPRSVLAVLDEAYFEFARDCPGYPDGREYVLEGRPNVVALRTFSKAYGLAGLRCGYGFAPIDIADAIDRARQTFHINHMAQVACEAALSDDEHLIRTVEATKSSIERMKMILNAVNVQVGATATNFVWADFGRPAQPIAQGLMQKGILTRTGDVFGQPNFLRISVGTDDDMSVFEEAINQVLAEVVAA